MTTVGPGGYLPTLWVLLASLGSLAGCEPDDLLEARYHWGAEVNVVCPCAADECYLVKASIETMKPLQHFVQRQARRPYQPVHLIFRGHLLEEAAVGFGANYDGLMQLDAVVSVAVDLPAHCSEPR